MFSMGMALFTRNGGAQTALVHAGVQQWRAPTLELNEEGSQRRRVKPGSCQPTASPTHCIVRTKTQLLTGQRPPTDENCCRGAPITPLVAEFFTVNPT